MILQEYDEAHLDDDSIAEAAVANGLAAAKQYEKSRPSLSPAAQQEMLDDNFPRLSDGVDDRGKMTEDGCDRIRASMRDAADEKKARSIANLREQLTEYHSLLDKLSSVTAKCEALEKNCQERGCRIQELEREVEALRRNHRGASCVIETNSCSHHDKFPLPPFLPTVQEISSSLAPFHPGSPSAGHQPQAPSPFDCQFHGIQWPSMESYAQAESRLWHVSPVPSRAMSPVPSDWSIDPTATSTGCYASPGVDCNTECEQADDSFDICPKRKASYEFDTSSSPSSDTMTHQQQDSKRFKSDAFPIPTFVKAFQSNSVSHQRVLDTNQKLILMSSHVS